MSDLGLGNWKELFPFHLQCPSWIFPADILPNVLALLGFAVVFFLIGLWRFKYE